MGLWAFYAFEVSKLSRARCRSFVLLEAATALFVRPSVGATEKEKGAPLAESPLGGL